MTRPRTPADAGFTMLEVMVTIGISSVLMAIAVGGFQGWSRSLDQEGTATRVQSVLREAQQRAVTGGSSVCVRFRADGWTVLAGACATNPIQVLSREDLDGEVSIMTPFQDKNGSTTTGVTFFSRGTSSGGAVRIIRRDGSKTWTIEVEGLTGRVSLT